MNSIELLDQKETLKSEAKEIISNARVAIRSLNETENQRIEEIKNEINKVNEELRSLSETVEVSENQKETKNNISIIMEKKFNLTKAIRNVANGIAQDPLSAAVIAEGRKQMTARSLEMQGQIQLPLAEDLENRAVTYADNDETIVATDIYDVLTPLRARNVLAKAGAQFITGANGIVSIPSMSDITCGWESETATHSADTVTTSAVKFTPKRLSCVINLSKMLISSDSVGIENLIKNQIVEAINSKIEATVLGTTAATTTTPGGLCYSASTLTDVSTYKGLTTIEATAEANGLYENMCWLVSPLAKANLRSMVKTQGIPVYVNNEVDGTPVLSTGNLSTKNALYGNFSNYGLVFWNGVDITVDNLSLAHQGQIRLIVNLYCDMKPLRSNAFTACTIS